MDESALDSDSIKSLDEDWQSLEQKGNVMVVIWKRLSRSFRNGSPSLLIGPRDNSTAAGRNVGIWASRMHLDVVVFAAKPVEPHVSHWQRATALASRGRRRPKSYPCFSRRRRKIQETHQEMRYANVTSLYSATLLRLTPRRIGFPVTISVKFCTKVKRWLKYKMAKKYCRRFQPPE